MYMQCGKRLTTATFCDFSAFWLTYDHDRRDGHLAYDFPFFDGFEQPVIPTMEWNRGEAFWILLLIVVVY